MRFLIGVVVASVALFFWGFIFWTVSPYPKTVMKSPPNQEAFRQALLTNFEEDGVYLIPGMGDPEDPEFAKLQEAGPIATLMFRREGTPPMSTVMLNGYLHMLGSVFLLAIVLATAGRRTYFGRFMLVFWLGLFVAVWAEMSDVVWFFYPLRYACLKQSYHVTSMIVVGAILAFFVRPPADPQLD